MLPRLEVGHLNFTITDRDNARNSFDADSKLKQTTHNMSLFQGHLSPVGHLDMWRGKSDVKAVSPQFLCQHSAHVVVIIIENDDRTADFHAVHNIIRCKHSALVYAWDRPMTRRADTISPPFCAGCNNHPGKAKIQDILRGQRARAIDLNVGKPAQLMFTIITYPSPG